MNLTKTKRVTILNRYIGRFETQELRNYITFVTVCVAIITGVLYLFYKMMSISDALDADTLFILDMMRSFIGIFIAFFIIGAIALAPIDWEQK